MTFSRMRSSRIAIALAVSAACWAGGARADDGGGNVDRAAIDNFVMAIMKGFYGTFDVSIDESTKGMNGMMAYHINGAGTGLNYGAPKGNNIYGYPADVPFGNVGWQPAISTNASGIGWRGAHDIPGSDTKFLIQVEAQVGLTASPGVVTSYTAQTQGVSGSIGLGNSFVGFGGKDWGAVKVGHGSTPYKKSTDRMDPFAGMVGDMPVIMGNTGGDNRVEFNAMMEHAIWYESPRMNGFSFDALFSPGQNRTADINSNLAGGSSNCNGGNIPGSGNLLDICDDGGFDNAYSLDLKFETKQLYVVAAYELHKNVNRNSDGIGSNGVPYGNLPLSDLDEGLFNAVALAYGATAPCAPYGGGGGVDPSAGSAAFAAGNYYCDNASPEFSNDIGDEAAYKVGAQYIFDMGLTVNAIFERLTRKMPADLEWANERQRNGWWLAATQELGPVDNINAGWAHAGKTPGDPAGQHNYDPARINDTADMFTLAWKHRLDKQLYVYADLAETNNHGNAHYDLGGGGHGLKTDCHDGTTQPIIDYTSAGNTTWGGCHPKALSIGVNFKF